MSQPLSYNSGNSFRSVQPFISELIPPQLQSSQFSQFVALIEAYFQFLEMPGNVYDQINSLDSISDSSIGGLDPKWFPLFAQESLSLWPQAVAVNQRELINNIVNVYLSKGTQAALIFLFRVLYNNTPNITFPFPLLLDNFQGTFTGLTLQNFHVYLVMQSGTGNFQVGEVVSQTSGFTSTVVSWNHFTRELVLNGIYNGVQVLVGNYSLTQPLVGSTTGASWTFGGKYSTPLMIDAGDNAVNNQYTYYINSPINVSTYQLSVKTNVHPAGLKFIGVVELDDAVPNFLGPEFIAGSVSTSSVLGFELVQDTLIVAF